MSMTATATADAMAVERRPYVVFHAGGERFALPLGDIREIARLPEIVRVPLSPAGLEGLVNLRGSVMAVLDLARILGFGETVLGDATRAVVIEGDVPVGLIVAATAGVVAVDPRTIEDAADLDGPVDGDVLAGMLRGPDGEPTVMILDAERILQSGFRGVERRAARSLARPARPPGPAGQSGAADTLLLLSFEAEHQEYALPVDSIQEVVRAPATLSRLPHSDDRILGVITLRNRLLPLVSLRGLLGLPPIRVDGHTKIVVVSLDDAGVVGLVTDRARQILRVDRALADPVPALLARDGAGEIEAICRLEDGRRLVSILSVERLFKHNAVRRAMRDHAGEEGIDMNESGRDGLGAPEDTEAFVIVRLGKEEFGLPLAAVDEIARLPEQLTRVPKTPEFIEGVVNLRGTVVPVIDQRRRFDLPEADRSNRQRIVIVALAGVRVGFIVDAVTEVRKIPTGMIGPAPELSAEQVRLISRVATPEGRMILLLDAEQLVDRDEAGRLTALASGDSA